MPAKIVASTGPTNRINQPAAERQRHGAHGVESIPCELRHRAIIHHVSEFAAGCWINELDIETMRFQAAFHILDRFLGDLPQHALVVQRPFCSFQIVSELGIFSGKFLNALL